MELWVKYMQSWFIAVIGPYRQMQNRIQQDVVGEGLKNLHWAGAAQTDFFTKVNSGCRYYVAHMLSMSLAV